ncbi:MAG TPA: hypothetical protein VGR30_04870 [Candidatus Binatia bacterium]|nr:hypothetical protein [Candidatus Binatia bacterium]
MIRFGYAKNLSIELIAVTLLMTPIGCSSLERGAGAPVGELLQVREQRQDEQQQRIHQDHAVLDRQRRESLRQRGEYSSERYELISIELDPGRE